MRFDFYREIRFIFMRFALMRFVFLTIRCTEAPDASISHHRKIATKSCRSSERRYRTIFNANATLFDGGKRKSVVIFK